MYHFCKRSNLEFKKEVYVSVIVTILTIIFIDPILKFIWSGMVLFGTNTYQGFLDSMYKSASLGDRNHVVVLIWMSVCSLIMGVAAGSITRITTEKPISFEKINKRPKLKKALLLSFFAIAILSALLSVTSVFVDLQLNTSFQQRLTVLAPKIPEQEYKELLASWASMENREDFELIVSRMETLAEHNNIKLPDLLLK